MSKIGNFDQYWRANIRAPSLMNYNDENDLKIVVTGNRRLIVNAKTTIDKPVEFASDIKISSFPSSSFVFINGNGTMKPAKNSHFLKGINQKLDLDATPSFSGVKLQSLSAKNEKKPVVVDADITLPKMKPDALLMLDKNRRLVSISPQAVASGTLTINGHGIIGIDEEKRMHVVENNRYLSRIDQSLSMSSVPTFINLRLVGLRGSSHEKKPTYVALDENSKLISRTDFEQCLIDIKCTTSINAKDISVTSPINVTRIFDTWRLSFDLSFIPMLPGELTSLKFLLPFIREEQKAIVRGIAIQHSIDTNGSEAYAARLHSIVNKKEIAIVPFSPRSQGKHIMTVMAEIIVQQ